MNNYKDGGFKRKGSGFGGKPKFGGDRGGNDRSGGNKFGGNRSGGRQVEMFKAECSKCNKPCSLPFKPTTAKPVFCSECFSKNSDFGGRDNDRRDGGSRNEYTKAPRSERSPRHDRPQAQPQHNNNELADVKKQLVTIEARLNRILNIINPPKPSTKEVEPKVEKVAEVKVVAKKATPVKKVAAKKVTHAKKAAPAKKAVVKKTAAKKATKAKK